MQIIAETSFNRDKDTQEYGGHDRIVRMCRFKEDGQPKVSITFDLGRREDDSISLTFSVSDFAGKIAACETA